MHPRCRGICKDLPEFANGIVKVGAVFHCELCGEVQVWFCCEWCSLTQKREKPLRRCMLASR